MQWTKRTLCVQNEYVIRLKCIILLAAEEQKCKSGRRRSGGDLARLDAAIACDIDNSLASVLIAHKQGMRGFLAVAVQPSVALAIALPTFKSSR